MATETRIPAPHSRSLWRNRDYLVLWSGQAVSSVGSQLSLLAFPLLILAVTGSPAQAGLAGALRALPYPVLCLPAGALVDRWDRKRVMLVCDTGRALALGIIPVAFALGQPPVALLYAVALIEGTLYVFFNLAESAAVPNVVTREQLPSALAQNEATQNVSYLLGPLLGGALFQLGRLLPFLVDAVSYAASVGTLLLMRVPFQRERAATQARGRLLAEMREGVLWLWRAPLIRLLAVLTSVGQLVESGYILVIIVLATGMHASPATIGLIFAIGGAGGVVGALLGGPVARRVRFGTILIGVHWIWALLIPLFAVAPTPLALGLVTAACFGITPIAQVAQYTYRLATIPNELQGRVNSVFRLLIFAGQPAGLLLAGLLLQAGRATVAVAVFTALLCLVALAATLDSRVRHAGMLAAMAEDV